MSEESRRHVRETGAAYRAETPENGVLSGALQDIQETKNRRNPHANLTPEQRHEYQQLFLQHFRVTANLTQSCEAAGISTKVIYLWRDSDEDFAAELAAANEAANDQIRREIRRRAIDGWDERLVSAGKDMGTIHKYSDTLLIFHAKARMPEYRDRLQVSATVSHMVPGSAGLAALLQKYLTTVEEVPQDAESTTAALLQELADTSSNGD